MLKISLPKIKAAACNRPVCKAVLLYDDVEEGKVFLDTVRVPGWV